MERIEYTRNELAAQQIIEHYQRTPMALVRSYGCQQSVNDGERMKGVLEDVGYMLTDEPEKADVILFNTCAVREHAEQRVFGNVGALKQLKAEKPSLVIGMCGCMTEEPAVVEKIRKSYPYVDLVLGVNVADTLPETILTKISGGKRLIRDPRGRSEIIENLPTRREHTFKALLPIMYGCDNYCTFCIVPHVRGRERSRSSNDVMGELAGLVQAGYKDITLLGQNVNSWGKGLPEQKTFPDLLEKLAQVPGEYRIRFMSSHPKDATRQMIDTMVRNPHLSKHLHLPVQSGSNGLLKRMNRRYTVEAYLELIDYAKSVCPEMTFSSDFIVGFPGETEEDFQQTLELVRRVGYTQLFTFIYSKRSGTPAASMPDDTPKKEKSERMARLLKCQEECVAKVAQNWLGKNFRALVEGKGRREGYTAVRLDNNMLLEFPGKAAVGTFVTVKATTLRGAILLGELVDAN